MRTSSTGIVAGKAAVLGIAALLLLLAARAVASHQSCECATSICSQQGFEITLIHFSTDGMTGSNTFTYKVCNDENQDGSCVPPKDLSHVDIVLPGIGECVTPTQQVSVQQLGCPSCDPVLSCKVEVKDASCDLCKPGTGVPGVPCQPPDNPEIKVLKCDVADPSNLDPGECVTIKVTIAGEVPGLGAGTVDVITKAGPECKSDAICGPACDCPGAGAGQCLTRTAGFWGTHPNITELFLPITVCGKQLSTTDVQPKPQCNSVTEALCVAPGLEGNKKMDRRPQREQLARQLAAAKLNLKATAANGGDCGAAISNRIAQCETLCGASGKMISESGCLEDLDAFNNSADTFTTPPPPFDSPGPANPTKCQEATGNGVLILSCP